MVAQGSEPKGGDTLGIRALGPFGDLGNLGPLFVLVVRLDIRVGGFASFDLGVGGLDGAGDDFGAAGVEGGKLRGELLGKFWFAYMIV